MNEILVLGATGTTGRRVAALLRNGGHTVRAASRAGPVRFDWTEPATWRAAIGGADRMYLMAPDGQPVDEAFVKEAVEAGVRRIVLLSSRGIEAMGDERLLNAERAVKASGAEWTIVRADWFDQNFDEGFYRPSVMAGELTAPLGDVRQAFVDAGDIAAVAVAALTTDGHTGTKYEVTGPEALSFAEAVRIIGDAAGRPVRLLAEPDDYRAAMAAFGRPSEDVERELAAFAALVAEGDAEPTDAVRDVTGHEPTSLRAYAERAAADGAWQD